MYIYLIFIMLCIVGPPSTAIAEEYVYTDAAVKAAYVLNIYHFATFPKKSDPIELCIIGDDLIGISIANQQIKNPDLYKTLKISKREASASLDTCSIVYLSSQRSGQLNNVLYKTDRLPILTVSDIDSFVRLGGMVELALIQNKVQMYINYETVKARHVSISAKLLSYAKRVYNP